MLGTSPRERGGSPAVSVIIPAFNAQNTILETLTSVLSQTWTDFEAIVVDDGSTDRTAEIAAQIALQDHRVRVCRQKNMGAAEARNRGIRETTGAWIAPLDADDLWTPDCLESLLRQARRATDRVAVVYCWSTRIDLDGLLLPGVSAASIRGPVLSTLICHNFLGNGSCTLIRRSALESVGVYQRSLNPTEDWDLYLRLAERYEFVPVPRFLVQYRQGPHSLSSNDESMAEGQARVLADIRYRNPRVPVWLCELSRSNLYIYFARRNRDRGDVTAMRRWLRRASQAHWFALVRPDCWWLWTFGGLTTGGKPAPSSSSTRRSLELRSQLIGSTLLHLSLRLGVRYGIPGETRRQSS
jgi:glycosyltransferase involved in cell wall biosynthesis